MGKNLEKVKQGKRNKAMGADFERRTRKDLEEKDWIVAKWTNNVKFDNKIRMGYGQEFCDKIQNGKLIPAKPGYFRMMQTGFPDFFVYKIGFKKFINVISYPRHQRVENFYEIQFIECKTNGYLSKEEKEKAKWYLENNYCSKFLIAYKTKVKNRVVVNYKEFQ